MLRLTWKRLKMLSLKYRVMHSVYLKKTPKIDKQYFLKTRLVKDSQIFFYWELIILVHCIP